MSINSISVIIPAYNVELYIEECLKSLKNQTVAPNEIIVIDDGSIDSTFEKVNSFKGLDNLKIYKNLNSSQGACREIGKHLSSSEYIYFLDSDDYVAENFIEVIKNLINKEPKLDLILFEGESFTDEEELLINGRFNKDKKLKLFLFSKVIASIPDKLFFRRYRNNSDIATCTLSTTNIDGYLQSSLRTLALIKSRRLKTKFEYLNARIRLSVIFKIYLEICYELKKFPSISLLFAAILNVKNVIWSLKILIRFIQHSLLIIFKK